MLQEFTLLNVFAENVKHYRQLSNFTQEELASNSGLHRTYISGIEAGNRNVSVATIEKIANAMKIEAVLLLKRRA